MPTLTLQPDEAAGKDTYLRDTAPDNNYGLSNTIDVGELLGFAIVYRTLIAFDLTPIPAGMAVIAATLTLCLSAAGNAWAANNRTVRAYRVKRPWVEGEATWNIYRAGNPWQTPGAGGADDVEAFAIGAHELLLTDAVDSAHDIALEPDRVEDWISGAFANNGLLLRVDVENDDGFLLRSSAWGVAGVRPKLVIEYDLPTLKPAHYRHYQGLRA